MEPGAAMCDDLPYVTGVEDTKVRIGHWENDYKS